MLHKHLREAPCHTGFPERIRQLLAFNICDAAQAADLLQLLHLSTQTLHQCPPPGDREAAHLLLPQPQRGVPGAPAAPDPGSCVLLWKLGLSWGLWCAGVAAPAGAGDHALENHYCRAPFLVPFPVPFCRSGCPNCCACWLPLSTGLSGKEDEGFLKKLKLSGVSIGPVWLAQEEQSSYCRI